jgi:hypothetical protein
VKHLQNDETWHALETDKRTCRQLPRIVTGIQPVRGCKVVLRPDIAFVRHPDGLLCFVSGTGEISLDHRRKEERRD